MAGCDADCRYNIFSCVNSGSTNDCLGWDVCEASKVVEHSDWPSDFYVIGDEAFVCTNNFSHHILVEDWGLGRMPSTFTCRQ